MRGEEGGGRGDRGERREVRCQEIKLVLCGELAGSGQDSQMISRNKYLVVPGLRGLTSRRDNLLDLELEFRSREEVGSSEWEMREAMPMISKYLKKYICLWSKIYKLRESY